jgi:hypothetical protein
MRVFNFINNINQVQLDFLYSKSNCSKELTNDKINYILSTIHNKVYSNIDKYKGGSEINAELISTIINNTKLLPALVQVGVLVRDYFTVGKKCYHYSFKETFQLKGIHEVNNNRYDLKERELFRKTIEDNINNSVDWRVVRNSKIIKYESEFMNKNVTILPSFRAVLEKSIENKAWDNLVEGEKYDKGTALYTQELLVKTLTSKNYTSNSDSFDNRIYGNTISNMKSELVNFLQIDNKNLIGFDITNSQLQFLSIFLQEEYPELINDESSKIFFEECFNGRIYELIAKKLGVTRQKIKRPLLAYLYDKVNSHAVIGGIKLKQIDLIFEEFLPYVRRAIMMYKEKNGYKSLSRAMQRKEADIILGLKLRLFDMGIGSLTIHDSLYIKEGMEKIMEIIKLYLTKEGIGSIKIIKTSEKRSETRFMKVQEAFKGMKEYEEILKKIEEQEEETYVCSTNKSKEELLIYSGRKSESKILNKEYLDNYRKQKEDIPKKIDYRDESLWEW